jgi:hypothetical protein
MSDRPVPRLPRSKPKTRSRAPARGARDNPLVLSLTVVAAMTVALAVVYFVYEIFARAPTCDQLFEQTASRFDGKLASGKLSVAFALGRQAVQKIDDGNQKVAIHLKNCCLTRQLGGISESRFERCTESAKQYESAIVQVVAASQEAKAANDRRDFRTAAEKSAITRQSVGEAQSHEAEAGEAASDPQGARGAAFGELREQEPNDTIFQANHVTVGQSVTGQISKPDDVDFFRFHYDGQLRDRVGIKLENKSPQLQLAANEFDAAKSQIGGLHYDNTPRADLQWTISVEPGADFYISVYIR